MCLSILTLVKTPPPTHQHCLGYIMQFVGRVLGQRENISSTQALKPCANKVLPSKLSSAHRTFFRA